MHYLKINFHTCSFIMAKTGNLTLCFLRGFLTLDTNHIKVILTSRTLQQILHLCGQRTALWGKQSVARRGPRAHLSPVPTKHRPRTQRRAGHGPETAVTGLAPQLVCAATCLPTYTMERCSCFCPLPSFLSEYIRFIYNFPTHPHSA